MKIKKIHIFFIYFTIIAIIIINKYKYKKYKEEVNAIAFVDIFYKNKIVNLEKIKISFCESEYTFYSNEIKDTIETKLSIKKQKFPCKVYFTYYFTDNTIKIISSDSFNCQGCSGTNQYCLQTDTVIYEYRP